LLRALEGRASLGGGIVIDLVGQVLAALFKSFPRVEVGSRWQAQDAVVLQFVLDRIRLV
jgi:hypothetical protein